MSTTVMVKGVPRYVSFRKEASGGWQFKWGGNTFVAWKDPAGFAGRAWNLFFVEEDGADRVIDDNLASRAEAVESAIDWSRFH